MAANCAWSINLPAVPPTFMSWSMSFSWTLDDPLILGDTIFQVWEILEYYCDSNKSDENYTNTILVTGDGINSWNSTNDSDTSDVVIQLPTPQIDIVKNDANLNDLDLDIWGNDSQTVNSGSWAVFSITVTNIWTENLDTVVITDPLVAACSRTNAETMWLIQASTDPSNNGDTIFDIGETFTYNCTDPVYTGTYPLNTAGVTALWVDSGTSVNDSDTSDVVIYIPPVVPVCTNLTVTSASWSSANRTYSCTWNLATSYNVVLTDPSGNTQSFSWSTGSFTLNTRWTYSASCFINGLTTTPLACTQVVNKSWWSGWGWSTSCISATFSRDAVTCNVSSRANHIKFTCPNWKEIIRAKIDGNIFTKDDCNADLEEWDIEVTNMEHTRSKCYASRTGTSWTTRWACQYDPGGWGWPYCWDGVVQTYKFEECDDWNNINGDWCQSNCKVDIITLPYSVDLKISDVNEHYVIWNTMNLYNVHNISKPVITNNSTDLNKDIFIPEICVYLSSSGSLDGNTVCEPVWMLYPKWIEEEIW
jgi:cysteine-rich repeat protein